MPLLSSIPWGHGKRFYEQGRKLKILPRVTEQTNSLFSFPVPSFRTAYGPILPHFTNMSVSILRLFTDPSANMAVLHTQTHVATVSGPYDNEYLYFLHANAEGDRLQQIEEFVDSAKAQTQGAALKKGIARWQMQQQEQQQEKEE